MNEPSRELPDSFDDDEPTLVRVVAGHDARGARPLGRVLTVLLGLGFSILSTYALPSLRSLRPWVPDGEYVPFWNLVGRELLADQADEELEQQKLAKLAELRRKAAPLAEPRVMAAAPREGPLATFPPYTAALDAPAHSLEHPEALAHYFERLTLVDLGTPGAIARAGHWGDSVLGVDGITSAIRRRLQSRFGDAGHGFHMMDRYHPSYLQQGVGFTPGKDWLSCIIVQQCNKADRRYGYGGLVSRSSGGAASAFWTPNEGFGRSVSRFQIWFGRHDAGGNVQVFVDGQVSALFSTRGSGVSDGWYEVRVPEGSHQFAVHAVGRGEVRTYGVVLENDGPGVTWDGMALIGGSTRALRTQDPEHVASQIRHRDLDLIVFMFGGNDMGRQYADLNASMQPYLQEYSDVISRFRAGKPELSCLIMTLTDHGERNASGRIVSRPFAKALARAQAEVARQNGCGFFDTYQATGGEGTAARWARSEPRLISPDLGHPTPDGHELIAGMLSQALLEAYERYRVQMAGKPLPTLQGDATSLNEGSR
jgi:lysophospholipase L1-like esterase